MIYQVAWDITKRLVTIQENNATLPVGSVKISTFEHTDSSHPSDVLFQHVRDALESIDIESTQSVRIVAAWNPLPEWFEGGLELNGMVLELDTMVLDMN